jgi:hypothetical protein
MVDFGPTTVAVVSGPKNAAEDVRFEQDELAPLDTPGSPSAEKALFGGDSNLRLLPPVW